MTVTRTLVCGVAAVALVAACTTLPQAAATDTPKNIFFFIGDGMGSSHRQLAEGYTQWKNDDQSLLLGMNDMPVQASLTTGSESSEVTDSAAAGTALATGLPTRSGVIGMDGGATQEYTSILKALQAKGKSVGLATTVTITHATPASFGANVADRNDEMTIAEQYLANEYDYLAGGGSRYFLDAAAGGSREAGDNLAEAFGAAGYSVDLSLADVADTDFTAVDKYLGVYESKYLTDVITQANGEKTSPTLADMVRNGIDVLSQDEDGFFMMVEGGFIDGAAHNNDTATVLQETLAFEESVQVALEFYRKAPEDTLIVVAADHETGGLALGYNSYSINYEKLDEITGSFGQQVDPFIRNQDWDGAFAAIEKLWNVQLTDADKADIKRRVEEFPLEAPTPEELQQMEGMRHMFGFGGYAAAPVLARITKIGWSTQTHTAEPVALTAIGVGSEAFADNTELTDVPNAMAELMGVGIGHADAVPPAPDSSSEPTTPSSEPTPECSGTGCDGSEPEPSEVAAQSFWDRVVAWFNQRLR
ncbi:MAG: alkaline phosphatase [Propioniciclava sp.]